MDAVEKIKEQLIQAENQPLEIDGRIFRVSKETTFRQDLFVANCMLKAGIDEIDHTSALKTDGSGVKKAVQGVLLKAYESGQLFLLLSGTLVEDGTEWSEESAVANAQFLADAKDPKVKEQIAGLMSMYLLGFWLGAVKYTETSRKSSQTAPSKKKPKISLVPDVTEPELPPNFVAQESLDTGTSSSES